MYTASCGPARVSTGSATERRCSTGSSKMLCSLYSAGSQPSRTAKMATKTMPST